MSVISSREAVSSISARNGCPNEERTTILPKPAAEASNAAPASAKQDAAANTDVFILSDSKA